MIHSIYSVARNINYLNQEAKVQFCPSSVLKETRHEPEELALPCGCIIGEYHCDEAVKLALDAAHAFRGCQNAPVSDYDWKRYDEAQLAYYDHISKGVKYELTEETV